MNCANHPEREKTAFCQNCGKPLCQECTRTVGSAVFCEPCLEARLAATAPPPAGTGYTASGSAGGANYTYTTGPAGGNYTYNDPISGYTASGPIPPQPPTGAANPGLAALLGFIPGVGAMYNGQYAKGVVHLIVFAILISLSENHGVFGLFVAGWMFYQVFDAYQTAVSRRDGTPLPNPFGLNDVGDKLGFSKSWTSGSSTPYAAPSAAPYTPPPAESAAPPAPGAPQQQQAQWETPWTNYVPPTSNPYMNTPPAFDPGTPYRNRFPAGAIWLIGLGVLFLIGNSGIFRALPMHIFFPVFLIGLGGWIFYNRMTATGTTLADDGTAYYRMRLASALRGSIWIILVGVMFLLSNLHILSWGHSWPLFIIVAGVLILVERTAFASSAPAYYPPQPYQAPPAASSSPTSVVPPAQHEETPNQFNQEGR